MADRHPRRRLFTCVQAYEYAHAAFTLLGPHLRRDLLHGDRLPRRPRADRHDLPGRLPAPRLSRALHADSSISASSSPPGTGTSSTWSGCSCSPASTSGAPARRSPHTDAEPLGRLQKEAAHARLPFFRRFRLWPTTIEHARSSSLCRPASPAAARAARQGASCSRASLTLRPRCDACGLDYNFADAARWPCGVHGAARGLHRGRRGALIVEFKLRAADSGCI